MQPVLKNFSLLQCGKLLFRLSFFKPIRRRPAACHHNFAREMAAATPRTHIASVMPDSPRHKGLGGDIFLDLHKSDPTTDPVSP